MSPGPAAPPWTCSSSAAARQAWPWATTWRRRGCPFRSWTPALRSATCGARGGIRFGCSPGAGMTTCRACPSPPRRMPIRAEDDVADYLQAYAAKFNLPVRLDVTRVTSLTTGGGGLRRQGGRRGAGGQAGGGRHRALPGAGHPASCRRAYPACTRSTAHTTGTRKPSRRERSWSSAPRTPAARSPRSSPRPTGWSSPPASGSRRSRSGRWAVTSGPGRPGCGWTKVTADSRLGSGWPGGTR